MEVLSSSFGDRTPHALKSQSFLWGPGSITHLTKHRPQREWTALSPLHAQSAWADHPFGPATNCLPKNKGFKSYLCDTRAVGWPNEVSVEKWGIGYLSPACSLTSCRPSAWLCVEFPPFISYVGIKKLISRSTSQMLGWKRFSAPKVFCLHRLYANPSCILASDEGARGLPEQMAAPMQSKEEPAGAVLSHMVLGLTLKQWPYTQKPFWALNFQCCMDLSKNGVNILPALLSLCALASNPCQQQKPSEAISCP